MTTTSPAAIRAIGAFSIVLGATTLGGWALGIPQLLQIRPDWTPMVFNTAVGFVLCGLGLIAGTLAGRRLRWAGMILGALIVLLGIEELLVIGLDISPALSMPELHRSLQPGYPHPGRMAPNTALCFLLFGAALVAVLASSRQKVNDWAKKSAVAVMAIGLLGVVGYSLQLEYLYAWSGVVRMAVHTGVAMVVVGLGLWQLAERRVGYLPVSDGEEVAAVFRTATFLMLVIGASAGIAGFAFLQNKMESELHDHLRQMVIDRATLFDQIIQHRSARAKLAAEDAELAGLLETLALQPDDAAALRSLQDHARVLLSNGFSSVVAEAGGRRWRLGGVPAHPGLAAPLRDPDGAWLLWQGRYLLRRALPLRDSQGVVGMLITEQPLTAIDAEAAAVYRLGATSELAVCEAIDAGRMRCFPQRFRHRPYVVNRVIDGQPLPMDHALGGEVGAIVALDYRRQRVLAAFSPIGRTGLGIVVKKDISEIYAPIRQQFQRIAAFLAALIVAGLWLLRRRLRPLLRTLEETRAQARAAVESHRDAFFILECVRDGEGKATDLRYLLLNRRAEKTLRLPRQEVIGRGMGELYPELRSNGMLATYLQAVETGEPVVEERSYLAHDGHTRWYNLQAVKLGDGLTVIVRDITVARAEAAATRHQALHDPLTKLANRAGFELAVATAFAEAALQGSIAALVLLDLDGFKQVNDSQGHAAGDQLLQEVAVRLRSCLRPSDTVARLGGDEFVAVLTSCVYPDGAGVVAAKMLKEVARPMRLGSATVQVTASIGISAWPRDGTNIADLLKLADQAMYQAKRKGSNRFAFHSDDPPAG